jgi:hypothetical protein
MKKIKYLLLISFLSLVLSQTNTTNTSVPTDFTPVQGDNLLSNTQLIPQLADLFIKDDNCIKRHALILNYTSISE